MEKIYSKCNERGIWKSSVETILNACLNALNVLLKDIKEQLPDKFETLINNLFKKYKINEECQEILQSIKLDNYSDLINEKDLLCRALSAALEFLNYHKYNHYSTSEEIDIDISDFVNIYSLFEYDMVESLQSIMAYEDVIKYYQELNDKLTISRRNPDNFVPDLVGLLKFLETQMERFQLQDAILCLKDDNKMILKVTKCKWADVLRRLDSELAYAMLCSGDFERAKSYNPDFILSRTKTIMQGNNYCDFCYIDTRIDKEKDHPSLEFWNSLS